MSMMMSMKIRKLKLFYFQKNARYRAKELCRDIFLGNLSLKEGKISVGLPVSDFRILVTSRENQEYICRITSGFNERVLRILIKDVCDLFLFQNLSCYPSDKKGKNSNKATVTPRDHARSPCCVLNEGRDMFRDRNKVY